MESDKHLLGDPQSNNSSGNEEGVNSASKKARRKRRVRSSEKLNQEQQQPHIDERSSGSPYEAPEPGAGFIFVCPISSFSVEKPTIVEGSLQNIEERPERLLPQRRQGRRNHSPLSRFPSSNKPSTAK